MPAGQDRRHLGRRVALDHEPVVGLLHRVCRPVQAAGPRPCRAQLHFRGARRYVVSELFKAAAYLLHKLLPHEPQLLSSLGPGGEHQRHRRFPQ